MERNGDISARGKFSTPRDGREELVEAIGKLFDELSDVEGIAICMPGIIDSENGYCVTGGALCYNDDFYFRHVLYERCPVRIVSFSGVSTFPQGKCPTSYLMRSSGLHMRISGATATERLAYAGSMQRRRDLIRQKLMDCWFSMQ